MTYYLLYDLPSLHVCVFCSDTWWWGDLLAGEFWEVPSPLQRPGHHQCCGQQTGPGQTHTWMPKIYYVRNSHWLFMILRIVFLYFISITQTSSEIVRTMLRMSEVTTSPTATCTKPLSANEIFRSLPSSYNIARPILDQYLTLLVDDPVWPCKTHHIFLYSFLSTRFLLI